MKFFMGDPGLKSQFTLLLKKTTRYLKRLNVLLQDLAVSSQHLAQLLDVQSPKLAEILQLFISV